MSAIKKIQLYLNHPQLHKLQSRKSFQLTHPQIESGSGLHHVELEMFPEHYEKLLHAVHKRKGFRFGPEVLQGGTLKSTTKRIVEAGRKYIPKQVVETIAHKGADAIGKYFGHEDKAQMLHPLLDLGVSKAYGEGIVNKNLIHSTGYKLDHLNKRPAIIARPTGHADHLYSGCQQHQYFGGDVLSEARHYLGFGLQDDLNKVGHYFGCGIGHRTHVKGGTLRHGVPSPIYTAAKIHQIKNVGPKFHQSGTGNGLMHGGSFLPLG